MKIVMVAFCADKKAIFAPTKRQLTKLPAVAFLSDAVELYNGYLWLGWCTERRTLLKIWNLFPSNQVDIV